MTEYRMFVSAEEIPPEEADRLLERLAEAIVRRGMTVPALFALEMAKPLNFVGSQVMIALSPLVTVFLPRDEVRKVALLLERDVYLESLLQRIERLDAEAQRQRGQPRHTLSQKRPRSHDRFDQLIARIRKRLSGSRRGDALDSRHRLRLHNDQSDPH